jgi:cytochrome P450
MYIPILGFHMDPKLFPNPEKFDPERFSAENKGNIVTGSFIPFGQGPRMCLGKNFIRVEGKCFLANLIRSFRILPTEKTPKDLVWDIEGQGKIKNGLWVKLEKRID